MRLILFFISVISVTKCDDPTDYESDDYNDSDYNYNSGNLSAKNETLLEEIIIIGNVSYSLDDLPTYNVTINLNLPEIKPLKHLFILSTAFIDAIWKPFEEIEDFLFSLLTLQDAEQIDFVSENWKQLAEFEIGFIVCLILGLLFVVLFPIIGIFFCGCRCCDNCGGRLYQDMKDATSGWRIFHCISLMITTTLMMIGMIFIFLTNNWISEVAKEIGPATIQNIDHIYNYADNIRYQADEVFESYLLVENATKYELNNIGDILGEPMMFHLQEIFDPVFGELMNFEGHMESIRKGLEEISRQNIRLRSQTDLFETDFGSLNGKLLDDLNFESCRENVACNELTVITKAMNINADLSQVSKTETSNLLNPGLSLVAMVALESYKSFKQKMISMTDEIQNLTDMINEANVTEIKLAGQEKINSIPNMINQFTEKEIENLARPMEEIKIQFADIIGQIAELVDLNTNESIPLAAVRSKIDDLSQNDFPRYDSLRRSVGLGLGSVVAIVFGLNVGGICLGFCGYKREATPTNRGGASNIGGMCLMLSVFVSFFTGWILMLLTTTTFAIGGHAERYMCQTLQEDPSSGNFTGLQYVQYIPQFASLLNFTIAGMPIFIDVHQIVRECKNNSGMFELLKLDEQIDLDVLLNVTYFQEQILDQFDQVAEILNQTMDGFLLDEHIERMNQFKNGKWKNVNFDTRTGISAIPLAMEAFALGLDTYADKIDETIGRIEAVPDPLSEFEADRVVLRLKSHAKAIREIKTKHIDFIDAVLLKLEDEVEILKERAENLEFKIDELIESIKILNETIVDETPRRLSRLAFDYGQTVTRHIAVFKQWLKRQLSENLGACQPIYGVYTNTVDIACSYIIDSLNLFWLSLGWTTCMFVPSIIFASKLYKWFRRMDQEEYFEEFIAYDSHHNKKSAPEVTPSAPPKID